MNEAGADRIEAIPPEHSGLDRDEHALGLLIDLRHYCDRHGLCFGDIDGKAHDIYTNEIAGRRACKSGKK
jgi:hypothetical protein